jgi:general secretion pathway protein D
MKKLIMAGVLLLSLNSWSQNKTNFHFVNEEITKVIEVYTNVSSQKMIIDSTVRGKITILNPVQITADEAFNQLSEALAINGFGIVKNGDIMTVKNARSVQRDNIETSSTLPTAKPQRMATWVVTLRNVSADDLMKELRLFTSSYGEMSFVGRTNQLVITDWTSNLQRVAAMIKEVDIQPDAQTAKIVAAAENKRKEYMKNKKVIKEEREIKIKE